MAAKSGSRHPSTWAFLLVIVVAALAPTAAATKGGSGGPPEERPAQGKRDPSPEERARAPEPASTDAAAGATASRPGPVGRYIVVLRDRADPAAVAARHARAYGAQVEHLYGSALKGYAGVVPDRMRSALERDADVLFVSPDTKVQLAGQTIPTGVQRINAVARSNKGSGVNVAVLDTGVDTSHPDLAANIAGGVNCANGSKQNYADVHGHGTHVAGIIAARDDGAGVVGVAPEAKLWSVRVLDANGDGLISWIVCGIDFIDSKSPAKGGPIVVANMSLGGFGTSDGTCGGGDAMHLAICRAVADGVTFVVAAGNSGVDLSKPVQGLKFIPASYAEVITATALADSDGRPCGNGVALQYGSDDTFASFSNHSSSAADRAHMLGAPGVSILSTFKGGGYATYSGTSMASPHVAGAAALYLATHAGASPASVLQALKAPGEPPNTNFNGECGSSTTSKGKGKSGSGAKYSHSDLSRHPEVEVRAESF